MYIGRITRSRPTTSIATKRAVGVPVLVLSALFMVPFLAVYALYVVTALAIMHLQKSPKTLIAAIDYAGEAVLGR